MDVDIGARFKEVRASLNYSQKAFADLLDMGQSKLSKIERGAIKPDIYDVAHFCEVTSVSFYDLIKAKKFDFNTLGPNQRLLLEKTKLLNDIQVSKLIDFIDSMVE